MSIRIETDIPYGNAGDITVTHEDHCTAVHFTAHPHGGPEALWFCLRINRNAESLAPKPIKLVLQHCCNLLGGHLPELMRPVVRTATEDWHRLQPGTRLVTDDGRLEASWIVESPVSWLDVAFCYPYGRPEVESLIADSGGYWRMDTIGISQAGRRLLRVSNSFGELDGTRPGLYLIARQHSSETPGSWMLDGLLRRLVHYGDDAPLVWAVPLTNIDGVEQGDYGKDNFPYDLNRAWDVPAMRHEVLAMQVDIGRWKTRCQPRLAIDFHAPGGCEMDGIYAYLPHPERLPEAHAAVLPWSARLHAALGSYAAEDFARTATYRSRWETPTFTSGVYQQFGVPAFSFETPYHLIGEQLLTREVYRDAGARLADGLVEAVRTL